MKINFFFQNIDKFNLPNDIAKWINETIKTENKQTGEINIIFCSDNYLLEINKKHLNHDFYTDIVTFDFCEKNIVSGDLYISSERVGENAKIFNVNFQNELLRVIIHGVLHLIGFNDKTNQEQKIMTDKENFYLKRFNN